METITSKDNKRLKSLQKLFVDKALRYETGTFPTEGFRLTTEIVRLGVKLVSLYISNAFAGREGDEISMLARAAGEVFLLPDNLMDKLGDTRSPQGVIGVFAMPAMKEAPLSKSTLMLCHLQEPGNVGSVLRTAAAFGVQVALTPDCPDPYSPKVLRASMGGVIGGNWFIAPSPEDYIAAWRLAGGRAYAACLSPGGVRLCDANPAGALVLLGNEGAGLPENYINATGESLYIPICAQAESLGVAAAGAVIAYEMVRGDSL